MARFSALLVTFLSVAAVLLTSQTAQAQTSTPAATATPHSTSTDCHPNPNYGGPWVSCWKVRLDLKAKVGNFWACVSLGDPFGYYIEHHVYNGWDYKAAAGYVAWAEYADYRGNGVPGPYSVYSESSYVECTIP